MRDFALSNFNDLSNWIAFAVIFFVLYGVLATIRRALWKRLENWARSTRVKWDDEILDALLTPVRILIVLGSLAVSVQFLPETIKHHFLVFYFFKVSTIIIGITIFDRVIKVFFSQRLVFGQLTNSTRALLTTIVRLIIFSIGFLIVLDTIGISITPILASLGVGSIAVALALQDTLSNFFSGFYLLIDEPVRVGDFVKIDATIEGHVTKIGWRSTHVKLLANNVVVVPNSKLASATITNYDLPEKETAVLVNAGVSYSSDFKHVERITCEVAREIMKTVPGAVPTFEPFIRYNELGESSVNFTVILRGSQITDQHLIRHEFIKLLLDRYKQEGISIPFPHRVLHIPKPVPDQQ